MSTRDPRLGTQARRNLRAAVATLGLPCALCGHPIDYTRRWHLDEIQPRALGGDPLNPTNVQPAHEHCNTAAGAAMTNTARAAHQPNHTSGVW